MTVPPWVGSTMSRPTAVKKTGTDGSEKMGLCSPLDPGL
jgi:hypothetical protein